MFNFKVLVVLKYFKNLQFSNSSHGVAWLRNTVGRTQHLRNSYITVVANSVSHIGTKHLMYGKFGPELVPLSCSYWIIEMHTSRVNSDLFVYSNKLFLTKEVRSCSNCVFQVEYFSIQMYHYMFENRNQYLLESQTSHQLYKFCSCNASQDDKYMLFSLYTLITNMLYNSRILL